MADDVDEKVEISTCKTLDGVLESTDKAHKTLQDESSENIEVIDASSADSTPEKVNFSEEKSTSPNHEHVSLHTCSDDEKTATFDNVFEKDNKLSSTNLNTSAKEQISDLEIKAKISDFENPGDSSCRHTSAKVDEVDTIQVDSTRLRADVQPDGTEFRHRHLREKVDNIEEILPSQSGVSFEHGLQGARDCEADVHNDTRQDVPLTTETRTDRDLRTNTNKLSIFKYLIAEISRGYILELDEDKYADKRRKVYTFMKIPREVEKLMIFGFMLCLDCFIFMFTFLPLRVLVALWKLVSGVFCCKKTRILEPAQICDLLKASIILVCCCLLEYVDFSVMYHTVRGQSVIKLYVIYNMLEVADRLFSSFGQDILDALFWTATEPRDRKRQHVGTLPHFALGVIYVFLHAVLVLFQATCLNVAVNSHNKALLVILVSNQFVELKGSVFKRFERNNLFQVACSDIRERFHYLILVSVVCLRNLTEFNWNFEHLYVISPYLFAAVSSEYFVDWVKHAFITKFNDMQPEIYTEYRSRLAQDATSSRQKNAYADHFDLVSRRMGFIPLPLGSLIIRVIRHSIHTTGIGAVVLFITTYIFLMSVKILNSIILLGKASQYAKEYPTKPQPSHSTSSTNPAETTQPSHGQSTSTQGPTEQNKKTEKKPTKSLAEIDRYTLCSKEIVLF